MLFDTYLPDIIYRI